MPIPWDTEYANEVALGVREMNKTARILPLTDDRGVRRVKGRIQNDISSATADSPS
ncbi:MAG: hypothetical protein ACLFPP_08670 [Spirochaetaceae bacterium]